MAEDAPAGDGSAVREIDPEALASRIENGERVALLDVRNRDEVDAWRIDGPGVELTHVPYMRFVSARATGNPADLVDPDESYVAVCPRGAESAEVAAALTGEGAEAVNLAGGMAGWARVYRRTQIARAATDATVYQYRRPATGCLAYVVVSDGAALVVDPLLAFADRYRDEVAELDAAVETVLDTHVHADHFSGLRAVAGATGATPVVSTGAADRGVAGGVRTVDDGDALRVGDHELDVLATPGHTTGSISLVLDDVAFTGDALFLDGAPRPDLERGEDGARELAGTLHETLTERLAPLPDDALVAPGHYVPGRSPATDGSYTATLGELRDRLAAFSESRETFVDRVLGSMGDRPANFERIVAVNLGREAVSAEEAFELELGPNNCAVATE
ncbi:thiosulfate/3-mercaptopyruvate sulfurtransferase [Halomicrobium zhouii]|uniref:Thiosulfate/3-mercaptopyruvate sulfurtransferase n=1 Tax=Halomicrobium zhouii TaxID=767519 RepID=A0A1I6LJJ2_9EURY|nr:MBL fold metallo-hydrolase [Halomicrobium zhouii]SFS03616.1 thiosulfate/3-mercaptopyruvate sulfurtransferase [Halomicrobium zhouii]